MRLQNHPGEKDFPVRRRGRYRQMVGQARQTRSRNRAALRATVVVLPGILVTMALMLTRSRWTVLIPNDLRSADLAFPIAAAIGGAILVITAIILSSRDAGLPLREQRRYAEGVPDVTERQQQILALDGFSDFRFGGWNSSLEYWPARTRLGLAPDARNPFLTLDPLAPAPVRSQLDDLHRVIDEESLRVWIVEALADRSVSASFYRRAMQDTAEAHAMLARVAALAQQDEWDVRGRLQSVGGRPPLLLWGFDAHRVISAIRMAYVAGYIAEDTAWALLEQPAEVAFAVHRDAAEFHRSVLVGSAFMSDSMTHVQDMAANLTAFAASGWPAAAVPFGTASRPVPAHVRDVTLLAAAPPY